MPSPISFTHIDLTVPLFAAEFDPYSRGYLVVGGGGGESHTGVANTLALLDISSRSEIKLVAQIDLSRDEDSVQSLANLTTPTGLVTLAGINSSSAEQRSGINNHFRSFVLDFPRRQKNTNEDDGVEGEEEQTFEGKITSSGRSSIFKISQDPKARPYQRLLRLSPVTSREAGGRRIGAIATGHAGTNEIVLFNAVTATQGDPVVCARFEPVNGVEAVDLDLVETEENTYALAFCTDSNVLVFNLTYNFASNKSDKQSAKPVDIYDVAQASETGEKATVRCLRWLSTEYILLLQKLPQGGAELLVLHLKFGAARSTIVLRKRLPKALKVAAHLDVCLLDPDAATGDRQIIVAVAGQDSSLQSTIHVLTLNYRPSQSKPEQAIGNFSNFTVLNRVHESNIMKLTLSNFFPPRQPPRSTMSIASTTQYVKLASVAWGGTVVVDTFALTSTPTSPSDTADASLEKPSGIPSVRWVLSNSPSTERLTSWAGLITIGLAVVLFGVLLQSLLSHTDNSSNSTIQALRGMQPPGAIPPMSRSAQSLPTAVVQAVSGKAASHGLDTNQMPDYSKLSSAFASAKSVAGEAVTSSVSEARHRLGDLLHLRHSWATEPASTDHGDEQHILVEHNPESNEVTASLHSEVNSLEERGAKRFEELSAHEKELWKSRLRETGQWGEQLPETVLKGVFFSQVAAIVGGGLRDALLHH